VVVGGREKVGKGDNVLHIIKVLTLAELKVCICAYRLNPVGFECPYKSMVN
jgi:hypothetical protein